MLSIENPPPADPPCSQLTSPLKSSSGDERDSSSGKLVEKVDLSQSALDDKNSNNPPSNFSIRDYVFGSRSKNIKTNWPFSQKCFQLCLDHGVKELLPPFQSVDNLRNQPVVENTSVVDKQNIIVSDGDCCRPSDYSLPVTSRDSELASESVNIINSVRSEGDKAYPLATTSQSCSEIDSVPATRSSCLEFGTNILPESTKTRGPNKLPSAKKCSLTVKLSNPAAQSAEEDTRTSNFTISESMASKTCPVCKNFSSSSNTTLNAHIDQCLSSESTIKWTSNCEVSKHRMKPRKTRLMVDIYETALSCTLEDLDRRNGTTFAVYPSIAVAEETDGCADNKTENLSPMNLDKTCDEGAVYIDANGTKLRILSKFNDGEAGCSRVFHDSAPKKFVNDKGSKFLSTKKKKKHKSHAQKYHKILKSAAYSKKVCSRSPHSSEIDSARERSFVRKQNTEKGECLTQHLRSQDNSKFSGSGTIRQWTCSKRTGVTRKMFDHQGSGGGLGNEVHERPGNSYANRTCSLRPLNSPVKPACFQKSHKRLEDDDHSEQPYLRKTPLVDSQISHRNKRSVLQKRKAKYFRADDHSAHHSGRGTANDFNRASSQRNLISDGNAVPLRNADNNFTVNCKTSTYSHAFSSKAKKFSSLRKDLLLVSQASGPECRLKKSEVPCMSKSDEEEYDEQYDSADNRNEFQARQDEAFVRSDAKTSKVLKIRKKREESKKDEIVGIRGSHCTAEPCIQDTGKNNSSSFSFDCDSAGESDDLACAEDDDTETNRIDNEIETSSDLAAGRNFISFSKHSGIDSPPKSHADAQLFGEEFERPFVCGQTPPPMLVSGDDQEMFSAADIGKTVVPPDIHVDTELESSEFHGYYHLEVDPIPIPGPPGSFLPSPGRMCSEDLQGNSSLTSSRLQSSEDHPELVDRDSSDSPVSATSTLSNFTVARSDSRSSEKSAGNTRLYSGIEKNKSSFSNDSIDPVVENSAVLGTINAGEERCDLDDMKINVTLPKKGFRFKSDQPCCCARKEGASQSFALSYQDSPLLQRRTMSSTPLPASEKLQSGDSSSRRPDNPSFVVNMEDPSPSPQIHETNLPIVYNHTKVSADTEVKVPCRTDCGSVSPSASNPVLRLMGKNLLVVNKDESLSPQEKPSQKNFMTEANMQFSAVPGIHCGNNFQSGDPQNSHHSDPQGSFVSHSARIQNLDVSLSSGYKSHGSSYSTTPQRLHSPMFSGNKSVGSDLMGSFGRHEGYTLITEQIGYDPKTPLSSSVAHTQNAGSGIREIIVIDDNPESEDNTVVPDASNGKGMRYPVSIPIPSGYNPNYADLYGYKSPHEPSSYTGSGVVRNASFAAARGVNASAAIPVQWNRCPESSSTAHTRSLTSPSDTSRHLGSSVYYTPGFS
ncbi:PREDICTED: uncharacterized protein LOC109178111 [Ipomoea nil]|uniref:uncharacterized protein LOC109178111 n=1 Tax=Ipomoea nil TaxID=35883 RepID=UPI000901751D|nr:PREDICTED: uncharacterized protein LOC109178111 [Ipomoea nil]XP_019183188.1 PREDICTED: uncharacterized protein LOC109178111 [Ipomoea nil]